MSRSGAYESPEWAICDCGLTGAKPDQQAVERVERVEQRRSRDGVEQRGTGDGIATERGRTFRDLRGVMEVSRVSDAVRFPTMGGRLEARRRVRLPSRSPPPLRTVHRHPGLTRSRGLLGGRFTLTSGGLFTTIPERGRGGSDGGGTGIRLQWKGKLGGGHRQEGPFADLPTPAPAHAGLCRTAAPGARRYLKSIFPEGLSRNYGAVFENSVPGSRIALARPGRVR